MCSSSAARWNVSVPAELDAGATDRGGGGERRRDRALHVGARRGRSAGRPRPRPPTDRGPGRGVARRARRRGDRSTRATGARPSRSTPRRSAGPRRSGSSRVTAPTPARMSGGDGGGLVLGAAGVLAGRGDQRPREREDLVGVDRRRRRAAVGEALIYHGADGTRHPVAHGAARCARARTRRRRPTRGDRLAAVLAPLVEQPEPSLVFTVRSTRPVAPRRRDLVPRRAAGSGRDARPDGAPRVRSRRSAWTRRRRRSSARCRRSTPP